MKASLPDRLIASVAHFLDRRFGWDKLPVPLGILTLVGIRTRLRERNLYDTGVREMDEPPDPRWLKARTPDGTYNDLSKPAMGSYASRFGRNIPLEKTFPQSEPAIMDPNPRRVSKELLTRDKLIPAVGANVLVSAWLQFEVHDWFSHGKNATENPWKVELAEDDDWHQHPMQIERTRPDPDYDPSSGLAPTYTTDDSHWWDGSQIYGSGNEMVDLLRGENGKLRLDPDGMLPADLEQKIDLTGVAGNFWMGLGLLHTLFTHEHNAIVEMLQKNYPGLTEDEVYDKARLINAALMAKIHTVEWTPAVISHPTTKLAMNANWWGLAGKRITQRFGRLSRSDVISGIPGSGTDHHGIPYSLTEEFVGVYRMHPLLPDDFTFQSMGDNALLGELTFRDLGALDTRRRLQEFGMVNSFYSFGLGNPGVVCLHNYPRFLQEFHKPDGTIVDLAATDVLRVRERGVPRYNEFRRLLHMKAPATFEELTANPEWARQLKEVYDGDIEKVDMMVGNYAEPLPKGFAFSDTAFRIFILMASRRLKSDRFFTTDYRPEVYTEEGLKWVANNTMISVLLRHYPDLEPALKGVENGFASWNRVG
ncbi:MAG TPA: peroxidase family protein [Propionibacteriaceae bacterium]|nr:peroxidase family protein [Propionibacteriaceae bacterium]